MSVLAPGEGETIRPGFEIKVGRPELVLTESIYAPGDLGPDPHVHHDHVDSFFVLEGQLEWRVGPDLEPHTGAAGSFVSVPRDVLHTFRNPGPAPARFLNLHAPGLGFERYLRGDFPEFDQHYMPEGSGLAPDGVVVLEPGEGEVLDLGSSTATIKTAVADLFVLEAKDRRRLPAPAGAPPPAHAGVRLRDRRFVHGDARRRVAHGARAAASPRSSRASSTSPHRPTARFASSTCSRPAASRAWCARRPGWASPRTSPGTT